MTDSEDTPVSIGERLRDARRFLGLSQEQVADRLALPRPSISAIENGKRKVNSDELQAFAALYRVSTGWLLGEQTEDDYEADAATAALFRTARELSDEDRRRLVQFADFLRSAGPPPRVDE